MFSNRPPLFQGAAIRNLTAKDNPLHIRGFFRKRRPVEIENSTRPAGRITLFGVKIPAKLFSLPNPQGFFY
jgi:hypothetical protein